MSDGCRVYRYYKKRLRCRTHLIRKARGLKESLSEDPRLFGGQAPALLEELMEAVYKARENSTGSLMPLYAVRLAEFKALCEQYRDCEHKKTRELAREFLYDWDAIWRVLEHPELPLTNNEAERALRHWVIDRRISHGTRNRQGSRVVGLLASVIETCRRRGISPWS